jgi:hypothetical protein
LNSVVVSIAATDAQIIHKNGWKKSQPISSFLNQIKAIHATISTFTIFQKTAENSENSIFMFACIRVSTDELSN